MPNPHAPYHPIIYVRGFVGTHGEIDDTVGDPYMGFNLGSTKARQVWDGKMRLYYFESPLLRLKDEPIWMPDGDGFRLPHERYDDVYVNGEDFTAADPNDPRVPFRKDITLPYHSSAILRYCDTASTVARGAQAHHRRGPARPASPAGWRLMYGIQSNSPNAAPNRANTRLEGDALKFEIDVSSPANVRPGLSGQLRIEMRNWE